MSIKDLANLFNFIGGLGMFLYGMNVMADGLQKSTGEKLKKLLGVLTNNRFLAVVVGAAITAVIQSSSATTVMVVGFVNAGIINLTQAVGVIMGANIGTTITSWIVSMSDWAAFMKPEFLAPLIIGIGAFIFIFCKVEKKKELGEILVGFGVLFIGLSFMSSAIGAYKSSPIFSEAFRILGSNPILAILAGVLVTGIIQSSSASVGILQTLAYNGVVNWSSAVFITLGQNIGTCVTAILSSVGAHKTAKRAAIIHLLFNVIGAIIFGIIAFVFFLFNKKIGELPISSVQISIFHTIFNISNTIILFPFANKIVKLSGMIVKDGSDDEELSEEVEMERHLDERIFESPAFAVENAIKEVIHMGDIARNNVRLACESVIDADSEKVKKVYETEHTINSMENILTEYLVKVSNLSLSEKQHFVINNLFYTISDIERVGDHAENIADLSKYKIKKNVKFSSKAENELTKMMELVASNYELSVGLLSEKEIELVNMVMDKENQVDKMEKKLRKRHIERLANKSCKPEAGVIFLDIISNLERISDHAVNIAEYVESEI